MIVIVLAGGMGKRMKSSVPKVLHHVKNPETGLTAPMIIHVLRSALCLNPTEIILVVNPSTKNDIMKTVTSSFVNPGEQDRFLYIVQSEPLGTGHAVLCCLEKLARFSIEERILILSGDVPLLSEHTLNQLVQSEGNTILTARVANPTGYGRILLDGLGRVQGIVEEKDADREQKKINLVNCGIYLFAINVLQELVPLITNHNATREYYLTDLIRLIHLTDHNLYHVELHPDRQYEIVNINTMRDLELANDTATEQES